jgi:leucyl aminopeptidase
VVPPEHAETQGEEAAARMIRRALLSEYRYDRYLQVPDLSQPRLGKILLVPAPGETRLFRGQLERGRAAAAAVTVARDLANAPANEATPRQLAEEMEGLALSHGFRCRVLGPKELKKRSMGGILAVGSGSRQPPCLVRLERGGEGPIVALVGKGVTFDSGGLSIKPADDMTSMKYDKAGACSVLGAALGAAQLKLRLRLRVYLPLAENMPGGGAYRPSDIVRCSNGKTVEIVNTDAEGRLLLADAMAWAVEEGAESLVELSTLTGGAVTALGDVGAPLFSGDDGLAEELLTAAGRAGERLWRMPLWPEFLDSMKGEHGDLRNSAGCSASPCTAAGFLAHFVGELKRWAHLDIAGTAQAGGTGAATGFGVPTLLGWLEEVAR